MWLGGINGAWGSTVFYIGVDNNSTSDFEQEGGGRVDNKYYWENGDYTAVSGISGSAGVNWAGGMEPWNDPTDLGFARAITHSWTTHHIYFQLDADEVGAFKTLTFTIDLFSGGQASGAPPSSHNIDFYLDDVKFHSVTGVNATGTLVQVEGIDASGLAAGEHVLSWQRTGGVNGWINIDYVSLVSVPEPSRALLMLLGLGGCLAMRRR